MAPSPFEMNLYGMTGETDEIRQLERKSYEIARSMRNASADEQEDLQSKLKELLGKIFDLKIENTNERLDKMNAELNKLTEKVTDRRMSRDDIIMRRYNELIGENDSLAW
jgi:peptidoglycan hydrolase CwlO-like protein